MELNITRFFNTESPMDYQASRAEMGNSASADAWEAAMDNADPVYCGEEAYCWIATDNREAFEEFVLSFGAWEKIEIKAWTLQECNALLIQMIAGDMGEYCEDVGDWDWIEYELLVNEGNFSGNLFWGDDNEIYYYIGS